MRIPVVDIFAGPGGLGEGFSAFECSAGQKPFHVCLSVEKDAVACRTLQLRSFFRQFEHETVPEEYYEYLRKQVSRDQLFSAYPKEAERAEREVLQAELGVHDELIDGRIAAALERYGNKPWVLIGGPPCQCYSVAGRSRMKGVDPEAFESDKRHVLYKEYLRILAKFRPTVFVMENVAGLLSARINGHSTLQLILDDLRSLPECGYEVYSLSTGRSGSDVLCPAEFVVRAENYGVPQTRHRIILLGVREDIRTRPRTLVRSDPVSIEQVISDLPRVRSMLSGFSGSGGTWRFEIREMLNHCWISNYPYREVVDRVVALADSLDERLTAGGEFVECDSVPQYMSDWFYDERLGGVCNHLARKHMLEDLQRYLFAASFADVFGRTPVLKEFPWGLLPDHSNVDEALTDGVFDDRFRVQVLGRPATTITSHIAKDGHYFIHYDGSQCRSLTVREAARIQTFPDNYFFEGSRTSQYRQVGNAVPPLLARQIAEVVYGVLVGGGAETGRESSSGEGFAEDSRMVLPNLVWQTRASN